MCVCVCVAVTDRMGMRWRAEADSRGVLQTVRHEGHTLKDLLRTSCRHTHGAVRATEPQKEQRPFKAFSGKHHLKPVPPTHLLSWPASQTAYCGGWDQRIVGVPVPQCLATVALKLLLLIIKDCCCTPFLCLSHSLFFHPLQSQFANGCSNLVIYCCQRYASSKMH